VGLTFVDVSRDHLFDRFDRRAINANKIMVFANAVRLVRQGERILRSKKIGSIICNYPRALISSAVEMSKPKVLITRPDIPTAGLNLLRKR